MVIIGRALQGFGGGVFPLSFGIVRDEFEASKVPASIGLLGSTIGVGGGVGLPLGGLIADHASFSWVFWIGGAFSLLSLVTTLLFVPESPVRSPGRVDVRGAIVLSVGLVIPLIAVSQANQWGWGSPRVLIMYGIGIGILWFFVELEKRTPEPLVNIKTLSRRVVLTTDMATFLVGFALFGSFILLPQLAQEPKSTGYGFGLSATLAGLLLMPNALVNLFIGPLSGRLGGKHGARVPLLIGCVLAACRAGAAGDRARVAARGGAVRDALRDRDRVRVLGDAEPGDRGGRPARDRRGHRGEHDRPERRGVAGVGGDRVRCWRHLPLAAGRRRTRASRRRWRLPPRGRWWRPAWR